MTSADPYTVACIELFTRIWTELEALVAPEEARHSVGDDALTDDKLEIVRLELVLLLDACRSNHLTSRLNIVQRPALRKTLSEVLDDLNTASDDGERQDFVLRAQNRLFDAVYELCATHAHPFAVAS